MITPKVAVRLVQLGAGAAPERWPEAGPRRLPLPGGYGRVARDLVILAPGCAVRRVAADSLPIAAVHGFCLAAPDAVVVADVDGRALVVEHRARDAYRVIDRGVAPGAVRMAAEQVESRWETAEERAERAAVGAGVDEEVMEVVLTSFLEGRREEERVRWGDAGDELVIVERALEALAGQLATVADGDRNLLTIDRGEAARERRQRLADAVARDDVAALRANLVDDLGERWCGLFGPTGNLVEHATLSNAVGCLRLLLDRGWPVGHARAIAARLPQLAHLLELFSHTDR